MNTNKSLRTIKLVLPALLLSIILYSFIDSKEVRQEQNTAVNKLNNTYIYRFTGDVNDPNSVQNKSKWSYDSEATLCDDEFDAMACTIAVDAAHHTGTDLSGSAASDLSITADDDVVSGTFRVVSADGNLGYSATVSNQPIEQ